MKTKIINLYGGPGAGKSTLAAALFAHMKLHGDSVELVREYVKMWAWRGEAIGEFDDVYIFGKQLRAEAQLYGKVDWIVTDSPLGTGGLYERLYRPEHFTVRTLAADIRERQYAEGLRFVDCLVVRDKPYVSAGRFETEDQARAVDRLAEEYLNTLAGGFYRVRNLADAVAAL